MNSAWQINRGFLVVFLIGVAGVMPSRAGEPAPGRDILEQPRIELSEERWDLGELWFGDPASHTVRVTNKGDAELKISQILPGCGCVFARMGKTTLAAGESTDLTIQFDSRKKQGPIVVNVRIDSNDPQQPYMVFPITGIVRKLITLTPPPPVLLRASDPTAVLTQVVRIEDVYTKPMKLERIAAQNEKFDVSVKEIEPGRVYDVTFKNKLPTTQRTTSARVSFSTGLDRQPTLTIQVKHIFQPSVSLSRPVIYVPKTSSAPSQQIAQLRFYGDGDYNITEIRCSSEKIRVEFNEPLRRAPTRAPNAPRSVQPVTIRLPSGAEMPEEDVTIEFHTNDPKIAVLRMIVTTDLKRYRRIQNLSQRRGIARPPQSPVRRIPIQPKNKKP